MSDVVDKLARGVSSKLRAFGFPKPSTAVVQSLLQTAYLASFKTEEGRFVRGSLTFSDPAAPDVSPPFTRRADYPGFTKFDRRRPLTVDSLVKLARAVDKWSASIAVWGTGKTDLVAWGVVDQLAKENVRLNREGTRGFGHPGIFTINMEGVGDLSVYHGNFFLGALRGQRLIVREIDALRSPTLGARVLPSLTPLAYGIAKALHKPAEIHAILGELLDSWADTIARLCIGLRRLGTGGSFLISPKPSMRALDVTYGLRYHRLGSAMTLHVLDTMYSGGIREELWAASAAGVVSTYIAFGKSLAEADMEDRESELGGAIKLVTSLAGVDGLVLMNPDLTVVGFGVKIGPGPAVATVYDGPDFVRKGKQARKIKLAGFGTRHTSMLRYCRLDPDAIGVVVSQDGHVRLIMSLGRSLTLWDDVKLLGYNDYSHSAARHERNRRTDRAQRQEPVSLGYTSMPKTIAALLPNDHNK